jgi:DNA-binding IclR family transcriptional regulator
MSDSFGDARLADRTGIHKATAFRILATLVEVGILEQTTPGRPYELGFFALRCADAILGVDALRKQAIPIMTKLRDELNETVVLARRRGMFVLNLDKVVSRHGIVEAPTMGVSTWLHDAPAGLAILSTFDKPLLDEYFAAADPSLTPAQQRAIAERSREARAQGAIRVMNDRLSPILAAPISNSADEATAALSIAIPAGRAEPQFAQLCLGKLIKAARRLAIQRPPRSTSAPGSV